MICIKRTSFTRCQNCDVEGNKNSMITFAKLDLISIVLCPSCIRELQKKLIKRVKVLNKAD